MEQHKKGKLQTNVINEMFSEKDNDPNPETYKRQCRMTKIA